MITDHDDLIIDVRNLCKSFNKKQVVCNVSLQIKKGEIFGFLGPNGSGKTTTLRMICGLLNPDSGEGTCFGYNILTETKLIKQHIGYMTQHFSLYKDLSIRENLEFIARMYNITNAKVYIDECLNHLGFSYEQAKKLAGQLSGGWQQRLALAGAILHKPQALLLDEPTAGVDPEARREFWAEIHALSERGFTTLVTTHYMDEAERCHRLAYLEDGHILVAGTAVNITQDAGLVAQVASGSNLATLEKNLVDKPGVELITPLGNDLRIVGSDISLLSKTIAPYLSMYSWKQELPTLEEVFIHLVIQNKRRRRNM